MINLAEFLTPSHSLSAKLGLILFNLEKILQRSRNLFGTINENIFEENNWKYDLDAIITAYFSSKLLADGEEVPNDRCCRICGKIGWVSLRIFSRQI